MLPLRRRRSKGPIRLHIELERRFSVRNQPPWVEWEALCLKGRPPYMAALKVVDSTEAFTVSGELQWVGPPTMAMARLFGRERYWIRAVNRDSTLGDSLSDQSRRSQHVSECGVRAAADKSGERAYDSFRRLRAAGRRPLLSRKRYGSTNWSM